MLAKAEVATALRRDSARGTLPPTGAVGAGLELDDLAAAMAEARRRVARGEAIDLRDLAALVTAALGTPPAGRADRLATLLDEVGLLAEAVGRERDAAASRLATLATLATRGRASRAYGGNGG